MKIKLGLVSECVWPRTDPLVSAIRRPRPGNGQRPRHILQPKFCSPSRNLSHKPSRAASHAPSTREKLISSRDLPGSNESRAWPTIGTGPIDYALFARAFERQSRGLAGEYLRDLTDFDRPVPYSTRE